jgi:hypothetical protein
MVVSSFLCPSEVNPGPRATAAARYGVNNDGGNMGDWYVWGGFVGAWNRALVQVNQSLAQAEPLAEERPPMRPLPAEALTATPVEPPPYSWTRYP